MRLPYNGMAELSTANSKASQLSSQVTLQSAGLHSKLCRCQEPLTVLLKPAEWLAGPCPSHILVHERPAAAPDMEFSIMPDRGST